MDNIVAEAVAREARKRDAREKMRAAKERLDQASQVTEFIQKLNSKAVADYSAAQSAYNVADTEGPGLTDDFGSYSTLEQAMRVERFAGKSAAIDYIKTNLGCPLEEVIGAYTAAALAARPAGQQYLLQNPEGLLKQYVADAVKLGAISDPSWETFRAFVIATDKQSLMDL